MSEIPFVNQLGEALDVAIAARPERRSVWRRLRRQIRLSRLSAGLAVLTIGVGAATAATILSGNSTTLVTRGLSCIQGTPEHSVSDSYNVEQRGRSPQAACAADMHVPASGLVVCSSQRFGVVIYVRNASPAVECRQAGMVAGVPAGFAQATTRIATLERDLNHLYNSRDCFTPTALRTSTLQVLDRLGFNGWRVRQMKTTRLTGPCGQYMAAGNAWSDAAASLDGAQHEVMVDRGASRHTMQAIVKASTALFNVPPTPSAGCAIPGLEGYVTTILRAAGITGPILFAVYSETKFTSLADGDRQARYNRGCPVFVDSSTAPDGQTILVEIWQRDHATAPTAFDPPINAYKPAGSP